MQIRGPSEAVSGIILDFGATTICLDSAADADELIRAAAEAKSLLLGEQRTAQDDAGRAIAADLDEQHGGTDAP